MERGVLTTKAAVAVAVTPTKLIDANENRLAVLVANAGTGAIYIGDSAVTTATGIPVAAGATFEIQNCRSAVYGICASATQDTRVAELA